MKTAEILSSKYEKYYIFLKIVLANQWAYQIFYIFLLQFHTIFQGDEKWDLSNLYLKDC